VRNRIIHDETRRWWPYGTSPQRIGFLSNARNKALEPLQSADETLRLPDYDQFTKVVFVNDVIFTWQAAVRLLATSIDDTPGEDGYDLACGMDFFQSGEYILGTLTGGRVRRVGAEDRAETLDPRLSGHLH